VGSVRRLWERLLLLVAKMDNTCKYAKKNGCALIAAIYGEWRLLPDSACENYCGPNDISAQTKMLRRLGFALPAPPEGRDLLVWAKECIENGTVKLSDAAEHARQRKKEDEEHRQQLLAEMPKGFKLAGNLARHLGEIHAHYKKTKEEGKLGLDGKPGEILVSGEHEAARLGKCAKCPDGKMVVDDDGVMRCAMKSCGCYLNNPNKRPLLEGKAKYIALGCDNGHWQEIDEKFSGA